MPPSKLARSFVLLASLAWLVPTCVAYTFHTSCSGERRQQINKAFSEMNEMAANAAQLVSVPEDKMDNRVYWLYRAMIGKANNQKLVCT